MSATDKFISKGIDIPTPDEVIKKIKDFEKQDNQSDLEYQVNFFKKANECQIGEKIATLISKKLIAERNEFSILISSGVDKTLALNFIKSVVQPMFEQKGWITYVTKSKKCKYNIACWTTSWFGNKFLINDHSSDLCFELSDDYISIQINSKYK